MSIQSNVCSNHLREQLPDLREFDIHLVYLYTCLEIDSGAEGMRLYATIDAWNKTPEGIEV